MSEENKIATITDNNSANLIFDLINKSEQFGNNVIDIVICNENPWFKGIHITKLLEYKNTDGAIRDHVDNNYKLTLIKLYEKFNPFETKGLKGNQKNSLYINESGLYQLIFSSKQDIAVNFKK